MHDERPKLDLPPWDDADAILADSIFGTADRSQVAAMLAAFVDWHAGIAFDSPENEVTVVTSEEKIHVPKATKAEVATAILDAVLSRRSSSDMKVPR